MKSLGDARATLVADDFSFNDNIKTKFINETAEILQDMDRILPRWVEKPDDLALLSRISRNFHTLSVSSSRVGANTVNRISLVILELLDSIFNNNIKISKDLVKLLNETKYVMPFLIDDFTHKTQASTDPAVLILKAENLRLKRDAYAGLDIEERTEKEIHLHVPPPVKIVTRFTIDEDDDEQKETEKNNTNSDFLFANQQLDHEINPKEDINQQNMFDLSVNNSQEMSKKNNMPILAKVEYLDNRHNFSREPNEKIIVSDIHKGNSINMWVVGLAVVAILFIIIMLLLILK
ncbi:MAG: hypothetical protein KGV51_01300 [Moraxellaceae bacterium]|nr:hypothetical protein [Moraxellaceae bacterium]